MSAATRRPGRFPRVVLILVVCLAVFALAGSLGTAWYFSNQLIQPEHGPGVLSETVESVHTLTDGTATISLRRSAATTRPGRYSLYWPGGNAMLGPIVAQTPNQVTRILLSGDRPTAPSRAGMSWTYSPDPKTALNLDYSEIQIPTPLGPAPAWYIPAGAPPSADHSPADKSARLRISTASAPTLQPPDTSPIAPAVTWAITVHGSNADRRQSLKFVPVLHQAGLSILDITYRNDLGAPPSPDRHMHLGESEWLDLEAAVRTALSMGARHIVLYGGSMGGAIVLQFLSHSPLADHVSVVILDAPMLSVPRMMDYLGSNHHIPPPLTWLALELTNWRTGTDIRRIDALRFPPRIRPPVLLLQGAADPIAPPSVARAFAAAGPGLHWSIDYQEFPGAGHSEAWNRDPERAEALVLQAIAGLAVQEHAPAAQKKSSVIQTGAKRSGGTCSSLLNNPH